jgi:hypothetical protein
MFSFVKSPLESWHLLKVDVFQDVLDKLSDVGKKNKLLKFFKLVQDGKFPLHNIAFELFFVSLAVIQAIYIEMFSFVKSPLESWHLLKVDRVFISFMLKSVTINKDTKFIKKFSFNFKISISFQTGFHTYSAQPFY